MSAWTRTEADEASANTTFRSAGARQDRRVGFRSQDTHKPTPTLTPPPNQQRAAAQTQRKGLTRAPLLAQEVAGGIIKALPLNRCRVTRIPSSPWFFLHLHACRCIYTPSWGVPERGRRSAPSPWMHQSSSVPTPVHYQPSTMQSARARGWTWVGCRGLGAALRCGAG